MAWFTSEQLEQVKVYMQKAMDKYLKMKEIPLENIQRLKVLKENIIISRSSEDLMKIIYEANELTNCVKDY